MAKKAMNNIEALTNGIALMMERNPKVVSYGQDAGFEGGVFRATQGLQAQFGKDRVWDSPISEASQIGVALGLGIYGYRAVAEIQFSGFSFQTMAQLFGNAARYRNRSRGRFTAPLVMRMPVGGQVRALEHHSEALEALYAHIPGLKVVIPSNPVDMKGLIIAAIEDPDPVVFMEHKHLYRSFKQDVEEGYYKVEIGKAAKVAEGDELTIVTYGYMVHETIEALKQLDAKGVAPSTDLIDLRTIAPWDREMVLESVRKTGRLMIVTESVLSFSVASEVSAYIVENAFDDLRSPIKRVASWDVTIPLPRLEKLHAPNKDRIAFEIERYMEQE